MSPRDSSRDSRQDSGQDSGQDSSQRLSSPRRAIGCPRLGGLRPLRLLPALLAACLAHGAAAQSLDRSVIGASGSLSAAQQTAVSDFVARAASVIDSDDDAKAVEEARLALITPSRDPASTTAFRKAYAGELLKALGGTIRGGDLRRAVNAMQVLRFTRTSEAVDALIERANPASERNPGKRLAAAGLVVDAFEDLDTSNAYYEGAARRLRDAAAAETDPFALQQQLAAIGAAANRNGLPADTARNIRRTQAEAIAAAAQAMKGVSAADPRMQAIYRVLVTLRNDLLLNSQADQKEIGKVLAPALAAVIADAAAQWEAAHATPALAADYAGLANVCEVLLRLTDRLQRPNAYQGRPDGDTRVLAGAWESGDRAKFDAESKRWADIASKAPYR